MVLTRLSHAGGACPLGKGRESSCYECSSAGAGRSTAAVNGSGGFQKPLPPRRTAQLHILDLPVEILEKIFSFLLFGEVSRIRIVCQRFNGVAGDLLTKTFHLLQNQTLQRFQAIKAQMPRRESLRRKHPLVNQCDIIETLNMRLTLLQMTFGKHMERKHICFFAGDVLDEVFRIMGQLRSQTRLTSRITDELFDLSTMAMEYFKEHIEHRLPDLLSFSPEEQQITYPTGPPGPGSTCASSVVESSVGGDWDDWDEDLGMRNAILAKRVAKLGKSLKKSTAQLTQVKREVRGYKLKVEEQNRQLSEYASRLDDHDRKLDESARKFSTMLQDLNECKTELQFWRARSARCAVCRRVAGTGAAAAAAAAAAADPLLAEDQPPSPLPAAVGHQDPHELANPADPLLLLLPDAPLKSPPPAPLCIGDKHSDDSDTEEEKKMETRSKRKMLDGDEICRPRTLKPRKRVKN